LLNAPDASSPNPSISHGKAIPNDIPMLQYMLVWCRLCGMQGMSIIKTNAMFQGV
jgi:hypothetical protein